jgi:hypothetical protein
VHYAASIFKGRNISQINPLFVEQGILGVQIPGEVMSDFNLSYKIDNNSIKLTVDFDASRLKKNKIEEFITNFVRLTGVIINYIEGTKYFT